MASPSVADWLRQADEHPSRVGAAWQTVKSFALARRYPEGAQFPMRLGRDMVDAISGKEGLIRWLGQLTK